MTEERKPVLLEYPFGLDCEAERYLSSRRTRQAGDRGRLRERTKKAASLIGPLNAPNLAIWRLSSRSNFEWWSTWRPLKRSASPYRLPCSSVQKRWSN